MTATNGTLVVTKSIFYADGDLAQRTISSISANGLVAWLAEDSNRLRGEFALVLHPAPPAEQGGPDTRILKLLLDQPPLKTAVKLAADITGESRNTLYALALALKGTGNESEADSGTESS